MRQYTLCPHTHTRDRTHIRAWIIHVCMYASMHICVYHNLHDLQKAKIFITSVLQRIKELKLLLKNRIFSKPQRAEVINSNLNWWDWLYTYVNIWSMKMSLCISLCHQSYLWMCFMHIYKLCAWYTLEALWHISLFLLLHVYMCVCVCVCVCVWCERM